MKHLFFCTALLALAACDAGLTPPPSSGRPVLPLAEDDTCNAAQYGRLIGQDATALERVLLLGQVRIIRPGDAVTADFRPERINFHIGPDNAIVSIGCN